MRDGKKIREVASTGRSTSAGQARHHIYKNVWEQIGHANTHGCWLEVITLVESILADRLEARLAHLQKQTISGRIFRTAKQSAKKLLKDHSANTKDAQRLYEKIATWSDKRNSALHELAKLIEGTSVDWPLRYGEAKITADEGVELARKLSAQVRKLNAPRRA